MEMHDVMDSGTQAKLEQVIQDLERHDDLTKSELLQILGAVLHWLPLIKEMFDKLL